MPLPFVMLVQN